MHLKTIRSRVAIVATLFAVVLVGTISVGTYALVARGMQAAAIETAGRLADAAERVARNTLRTTQERAEAAGMDREETEAAMLAAMVEEPPAPFAEGLAYEGSFALHVIERPGDEPVMAWGIGEDWEAGDDSRRAQALASGEPVVDFPGAQPLIRGMFVRADIGVYSTYVPLELPGVHAAVLDVLYTPKDQEAILDATRLPMTVLGLVALTGSLLIAMGTTRWAISLIDELRRAADSVDVGVLDVRLPEEGGTEVADLARSLNRLIDSLQRRNEMQVRFIADASHELATPVAGIRGYVNILRAWGADDPALQEEAVSAIDRESRRMARLCSDLLSLIRSEEQVEYRRIRYDINAVCREVLANAATRYLSKGLRFTGPREGPLWLHGDPDRIEEALGIIVDNACKYTPDGGSVSVTTRRSRDRVVIDVSDTGVGIPEEDLPNVFERFYRSDTSRSQETGGFGLGLAIAKHIVDVSGGTISVTSTVGSGTTFQISLPRQRVR